jgi:hypothetical protein
LRGILSTKLIIAIQTWLIRTPQRLVLPAHFPGVSAGHAESVDGAFAFRFLN